MKVVYSFVFISVLAVMLTFCVGAFYSYFYPMKYKDEILLYSKEFDVDAGIIASVANVESSFNEDAKSSKGAIGLMQLMPDTAKWLAGKIGENYSEDKLYDGEYSIKLGSYYLSLLIKQFGDFKTAVCAYNAGPGNVKNWLNDAGYSKDGKSLNKIPFEETKNYLNKVVKNYNYYKIKYKKLSLNN